MTNPAPRSTPARRLGTFALTGTLLGALAGCQGLGQKAATESGLDVGLEAGYAAVEVVDGLRNPSGVSFSPRGALTVADSGNGRVLAWTGGEPTELVTDFKTEFWKVDAESGTKRFELGPLNAVWFTPPGAAPGLAVSDSGHADGEDRIRVYPGKAPAAAGFATNSIPPTSDAAGDNGEGNFTGFCLTRGGDGLFVCGQGTDAKTWILRCDLKTLTLATFASADDWGIEVNSPMQCRLGIDGQLYVLFSGTGGKEDGLIAKWDAVSGELLAQWTLPGLVDPMGMDWVPGTKGTELAVVDNNWALTEVLAGKLARVKLPEGGGEAEVSVIGTGLQGPTSCAFGPDGRLYVAELGPMFDTDQGRVIAIDGFTR